MQEFQYGTAEMEYDLSTAWHATAFGDSKLIHELAKKWASEAFEADEDERYSELCSEAFEELCLCLASMGERY